MPPKNINTGERKQSQGTNEWMNAIYALDLLTAEELAFYYESIRYKGFNRDEILDRLSHVVPDPKVAIQLILLCALRGPRRAAQTVLPGTGKTPMAMGIPASDQKGTSNLSCSRVTAATADLAAYYLKKLNAPKRLMMDCPAWLQFPSAGSIDMPADLRAQHIEFSKRFSTNIKGEFNEGIYSQMVSNSYYNRNLSLF
jgi:hypothetical protein